MESSCFGGRFESCPSARQCHKDGMCWKGNTSQKSPTEPRLVVKHPPRQGFAGRGVFRITDRAEKCRCSAAWCSSTREKVRAPPKITFGRQRSFFARTFA